MITIDELYELERTRKYDEELDKIKQYLLENYDITASQSNRLTSIIYENGHSYGEFVNALGDVTSVLDIVCKKKENK